MKHDVVYILKNDYKSEEIVYSIRSVCKNFPYNKIWIYGGKPENIEPDHLVELSQIGVNKWERVNFTLREICRNEEITEDFWLFNDDFFVMKKVKKVEPMLDGTLWAKAQKIASRYGGRDSNYSNMLRETARALKEKGYDRLNYALHVPMLINRKKGLETIKTFRGLPMFRSLYGNQHRIGGVMTDDVKIHSLIAKPTGKETYLSTDDKSFSEGAVGEYIRKVFPDRCKYEKGGVGE